MGRALADEKQGISEQEEPQEQEAMPLSPLQIVLDESLEQNLIDTIFEDYEAAKKARDEKNYGTTSRGVKLDFEKWKKELLDLYNSERIPKTTPWKFCSNRSLRLAKAILDMLHARLLPSVVNEYLLKFRANNVASYPKVDKIDKLMHWWLFVHCRIRGFYDDWIKNILGFGDAVAESSWSAVPKDEGQTEQIPVTGPDGQPVLNPDGTPAVVTSRKISLIEKSVSKVYLRDKFFLQSGSTDIQREPVILEDEIFYRDLVEGEAKGTFINVSTELREKLPFAKENYSGLKPEDLERIKDIKLRNVPVKILKWYGNFDADGDGFAEDVRIYVSLDHKIYLGGVPMIHITKSGSRPLDFTKLESRLENTSENWGYGLLETVKELAEEIDALFNQMEDETTLNVMRPGFYDPSGDLDAPSLNLAPNRLQPVSDPQRNIFFPQMQSNAEKIIMAIRLVLEFVERLTAASSYVMGKESEIVGGSGTATRTNAIMSAANERFGMPAERLRAGAASIVKNHLDLLQLNIPEGLEQRILGDDGNPIFMPNELSQEGIAGEFDAYLLPDPSAGSAEAEKQIANMLLQILSQCPIVMSNPALVYRIYAQFLKAYDKDETYYLGPAPDIDMIDDPEQENTLIIQGDFKRVQAQLPENHMDHIQKHTDFLQSPSLAQIPPMLAAQVTQFTQQHIQQHMMMQQLLMSMAQKTTGGKGGGTEQRGNPSVPGGLQGHDIPAGVEQISGPLGQAMSAKREGESGGSPNQ